LNLAKEGISVSKIAWWLGSRGPQVLVTNTSKFVCVTIVGVAVAITITAKKANQVVAEGEARIIKRFMALSRQKTQKYSQ